MKKILILFLVCTLGLFGLAGCGEDLSDSSDPSSTVSAETGEQESSDAASEASSGTPDDASSADSASSPASSSSAAVSSKSSSKASSAAASSKKTASTPGGSATPTGKTYTPAAKSLSGSVTFSGSTSVYPAAAALTEAFRKIYPKVTVSINNVTGSGAGLADAKSKKVSFGMRSADWDNSDSNIVPHTIALDGVALVVNTANPLSNITADQLFKIYKPGAEFTNWNELGVSYNHPIAAVSRESGSGTRTCFQDVMKGLGAELKTGYDTQPNSVIAASTDAVKTSVKGNPNAIGYMSLGSVDSTVKKLKFNEVDATEANVLNGSYKFSRPFLLLSNKTRTMSAAEKEFLKYALSKEGQAIVQKGGFISLDDAMINSELARIG